MLGDKAFKLVSWLSTTRCTPVVTVRTVNCRKSLGARTCPRRSMLGRQSWRGRLAVITLTAKLQEKKCWRKLGWNKTY